VGLIPQKSVKSFGPQVVKESTPMLKVPQIRPRSQICLFLNPEKESLGGISSTEDRLSLTKSAQRSKTITLAINDIQRLYLQPETTPILPRMLKEIMVARGMLAPKMPIANPLCSGGNHRGMRATAETKVIAPPIPIANLPTTKARKEIAVADNNPPTQRRISPINPKALIPYLSTKTPLGIEMKMAGRAANKISMSAMA
jgi:hypothetical protein